MKQSFTFAILLVMPVLVMAEDARMAAAREALYESHGAGRYFVFGADRFETHSDHGDPVLNWDWAATYGTDEQKLKITTEGEYHIDESDLESGEIEVLYQQPISAFWNLDLGIRHLHAERDRNYLAVGLNGLAPQWIEIDASAYLSNKGDLSIRAEVERDFRLTQRIVLQPRVEVNFAFSDDETNQVGSGFSSAHAGLRLRYEVTRELVPYLGISWEKSFGETADLTGDHHSARSFVAGLSLTL